MMDKKFLRQQLKKNSIYAGETVCGFPVVIEKINAGVLCLDVYGKVDKKIRLSVFVDNNDYITFDYSKNKWRESKINFCIGIGNIFYYKPFELYVPVFANEASKKAFFDKMQAVKDTVLVEDFSVLHYLYHYQEKCDNHKLVLKHKAEMAEFARFNKQVPKTPKTVISWIKQKVLPAYMIYDRKNHFLGHCTSCGGDTVLSKHIHRGEECTCSHCGRRATAMPAGLFAFDDNAVVAFAQRCEYGMVVRYYTVKHIGTSSCPVKCFISEEHRDFINEQGACVSYHYSNYKQTGTECWHEIPNISNSASCNISCDAFMNSKRFLKGTKFEYFSLDIFDGEDQELYENILVSNPTRYFTKCTRYPFLEYMLKLKFFKLALMVLEGSIYFSECIKKYEPSAAKAFGISKALINYICRRIEKCKKIKTDNIFRYRYGYNQLDAILAFIGRVKVFNERVMDFIIDTEPTTFEILGVFGKYGKVLKTINYLIRQKKDDDVIDLRMYQDYLDMCQKLEIKLTNNVRFPASLVKAHDEATALLNKRKYEKQNSKYLELMAKKEKCFKEFRDADHHVLIRLPKNVYEIQAEGMKLGHCVATYIDKIIQNKTNILFVRDTEKPDASFYTLEVGKHCEIIQCRTKNNKSAEEGLLQIIQNYLKGLKFKECA